jgi:large subunit ribosomal protein L9
VTVKAGYARNYLLPRGFAIPVTRANKKQMEVLRSRSEARRKAELAAAQEKAEKLQGISVALAVKTGPGGKVFGAVTAQDLINRLREEGIELDKKKSRCTPPPQPRQAHHARAACPRSRG